MIGDRVICRDRLGHRPQAEETVLDRAVGAALAASKAVRSHLKQLHDDPVIIEAVEKTICQRPSERFF